MAPARDDLAPAARRAPPARGRRATAPRVLLVEIALGVLLVFGVSGFFYRDLWRRAAEDLPRLLPERTLTWATSPPPRLALDRVSAFARWRPATPFDPVAPTVAPSDAPGASRLPFFDNEPDGEVFGLPLEQIRQLYKTADSVSLAIVPTEHGPASMLFVEVRDLLARKRVIARLAPFLEPHHRHVGIRVEAVRRSPWLRYAGDDLAAPRVVSLDPYLLFAWGPAAGLDDLLEARVGGESEPLAARPGFVRPPRGDGTDGALSLHLDPAALWSLIADPNARDAQGAHLALELEVLSGRARFVEDDENAQLRALLAPGDLSERLGQTLFNHRHELLDVAPASAPWVVSAIVERPLATLSTLRELALRLGRDLDASGSTLRALGDRLSALEMEAIVRLDWEVATAFAGEIAAMALPPAPGSPPGTAPDPADWAVVARFARPLVAEQALERLLPFLLGDAWSFGTVHAHGQPLHLVRPAHAGAEGTPPTSEVLAWRVDGPLLVLAPRAELLDRLSLLQRSGQTYGDGRLARNAFAHLPDDSAIAAIVHPSVLIAPGGEASFLSTAAARLHPDFRLAFALRAELPWIELSTNVGPWTLAGAAAQATREEIGAFTLTDLDPRCREAHLAMCALYPDAVPCRPLSLGRSAHIRRACRALFTPATTAPSPAPP